MPMPSSRGFTAGLADAEFCVWMAEGSMDGDCGPLARDSSHPDPCGSWYVFGSGKMGEAGDAAESVAPSGWKSYIEDSKSSGSCGRLDVNLRCLGEGFSPRFRIPFFGEEDGDGHIRELT